MGLLNNGWLVKMVLVTIFLTGLGLIIFGRSTDDKNKGLEIIQMVLFWMMPSPLRKPSA